MINSKFMLVTEAGIGNRKTKIPWRLRDIFDGQKVRGRKMPLEAMLEGLISQNPQKCDAFFSSEVINRK